MLRRFVILSSSYRWCSVAGKRFVFKGNIPGNAEMPDDVECLQILY